MAPGPSADEPVDLDLLLLRRVVVVAVDLPARAEAFDAAAGALGDHRSMAGAEVLVAAAVDGHGDPAGGEGRADHAADRRERTSDLDADLDGRRVVEVEHHVAA